MPRRAHRHFKFRRVEMTNSPAGNPASDARASMSTDAPKSTCPAARKFAEYLARRMGPMIQHAARNNAPTPADDSEGRRLRRVASEPNGAQGAQGAQGRCSPRAPRGYLTEPITSGTRTTQGPRRALGANPRPINRRSRSQSATHAATYPAAPRIGMPSQ
jgi:hypothetical protein